MSGIFVAIGVLMMAALGLAIGVTALGDPRAATGETASGLGMGAGVWAFISMLMALLCRSVCAVDSDGKCWRFNGSC